MVLLNQTLHNLFLVEAGVREHSDLVRNVIPCAYIINHLPGVFNYYSLNLKADLIEIIRSATTFS
jgi:hypothetical protein